MTTKNKDALSFLKKLNKGSLTFGQMLQSLRECEEVSQTELASKVGISRSRLCDIEKGRKIVSLSLAAKIAKAMKQSSEYFVSVALRDELRREGLNYKLELSAA